MNKWRMLWNFLFCFLLSKTRYDLIEHLKEPRPLKNPNPTLIYCVTLWFNLLHMVIAIWWLIRLHWYSDIGSSGSLHFKAARRCWTSYAHARCVHIFTAHACVVYPCHVQSRLHLPSPPTPPQVAHGSNIPLILTAGGLIGCFTCNIGWSPT